MSGRDLTKAAGCIRYVNVNNIHIMLETEMADVVARLDDWGRPAWIALMVGGFILFWPIGLAILAFLLWSGRMGCGRSNGWGHDPRARWEGKIARLQEKVEEWGRRQSRPTGGGTFAPSGNRAFDEYREQTLSRLEEEAREFRSFLDRLRHAKDKSEFDQFMAERRDAPPPSPPSA